MRLFTSLSSSAASSRPYNGSFFSSAPSVNPVRKQAKDEKMFKSTTVVFMFGVFLLGLLTLIISQESTRSAMNLHGIIVNNFNSLNPGTNVNSFSDIDAYGQAAAIKTEMDIESSGVKLLRQLKKMGVDKELYVYQVVQKPFLEVQETPFVVDERLHSASNETLKLNEFRKKRIRYYEGDLVVGVKIITDSGRWLKLEEKQYLPIEAYSFVKPKGLPDIRPTSAILDDQLATKPTPSSNPYHVVISSENNVNSELNIDIDRIELAAKPGVVELMFPVKTMKLQEATAMIAKLESTLVSTCSGLGLGSKKMCAIQKQMQREILRIFTAALNYIDASAGVGSGYNSIHALSLHGHAEIELTVEDRRRQRTCEKMHTWSRCVRLGYCAWRRLPNNEFCFLDNDYVPPENMKLSEYDSALDYDLDEQFQHLAPENENDLLVSIAIETSKKQILGDLMAGDINDESENIEDFDLYSDTSMNEPKTEAVLIEESLVDPEVEAKLDKFYRYVDYVFMQLQSKKDISHALPSTKYPFQEKFLVFQPSGGINNQRLQLCNALVACRLLNRTCVIPPAAPHTNYYENYNKQPGNKLISMQRLLNSEKLLEAVNVRFIRQGETLVDFVNDNMKVFGPKFWRVVNKDYRRYKVARRWDEKDMLAMYKDAPEPFLFFGNHSMWASFEWLGTASGYPDKRIILQNVMYNDVIKRIARKLSNELSLVAPGTDKSPVNFLKGYHAVHIRRGDKKADANFVQISHSPEWYIDRLKPYMHISKRLYIATDEKDREFFRTFADSGFEIFFWEDLDRELLLPFLNRYPARMFMDVLSIVEQLIASYSQVFLGSGYSTLSVFILRLRRQRTVLGYDTELGMEVGLPVYAREDTTCNPLRIKDFVRPC